MTVKTTTAGPVQLARSKLRGTTEAFASRLLGAHVTKTNALVIASFVRGLSVRDVGAADAWHDFLADLTGRGLPSPLLVISDGARWPRAA